MESSNQKREHIIIVPGGLLATRADADSGCSIATNEVDGDLAQDGQIASCRSIPDAAVILAERDIQDPAAKWFGIGISTAFRWSQRLRPGAHGHWKITTLVAGLRTTGLTAPYVLDGALNGASSGPMSSRSSPRR